MQAHHHATKWAVTSLVLAIAVHVAEHKVTHTHARENLVGCRVCVLNAVGIIGQQAGAKHRWQASQGGLVLHRSRWCVDRDLRLHAETQ